MRNGVHVCKEGVWGAIMEGVAIPCFASIRPFAEMAGSNDACDTMYNRVGTFYAGMSLDDGDADIAVVAASVIAALFGAIHCIGWIFAFPSHMEQLLWRITITCVPTVICILAWENGLVNQ